MVHWRMTMHDHLAMICRRIQELIANPEQVFRDLLRYGDARPYSRVNEQKVSTHKAVVEALEKKIVCAGEYPAQGLLKFGRRHRGSADAHGNTIRRKSLQRAELSPVPDDSWIVTEKSFED